jgi:hypothetical protein
MKCSNCEVPTTGSTGRCRTCKHALIRGGRRARAEKLLVDTAGGAWWVWAPNGEVLAGPARDRVAALILLGGGLGPDSDD